jgi:oligoendopeptidase F
MGKNKYSWDLSILLDEDSFESKKKELEKVILKLIKNKDNFFISEKGFKEFMELQEKYIKYSNVLFAYLYNIRSLDFSNSKASDELMQFEDWFNNMSNPFSDLNNYFIKYEDNIREFTKLKGYEGSIYYFEKYFKNKPYLLDNNSEKIINSLSGVSTRFENIFSAFSMSEYKITYLWKNKIVEIDNSQVHDILKTPVDPKLRETVYKANKKTVLKYQNTLFSIATSYFRTMNDLAKIKKYDGYIHEVCIQDGTDEELIKSIYENSKILKPLILKLHKLKTKYLKYKYKIKNIKDWDYYLTLASNNKDNYSIEYAQELILKHSSNISKSYYDVIKKAFEQRWIDYTDKETKYDGAYCYPTLISNKSLLSIRYKNDINSIAGLNHELGHAVNFYHLFENNKWYNNELNDPTGEVASTCSEILFANFMIDNKEFNNKQKIDLLFSNLNTLLNPIFCSYTSQAEYYLNKQIINQEILDIQSFKNHMYELKNQYFRDKYKSKKREEKYIKEFDDHIYSLLTPHFYMGSFYYYKYSLSTVCAIILSTRIKNKTKDGLKNYEELLKIGNQLNTKQILEKIQIDLSDTNTWKEIYQYIDNEINSLKKLINKIIK